MSPTRTTGRPLDSGERLRSRRVSLSDRLALRIGLALVVWSRRTHRDRARPGRTRPDHPQRSANRRDRPERTPDELRRVALQLDAERRAAERRLAESMLFWR